MASQKQQLQEEQKQILQSVDFLRSVMLKQAKTEKIKKLIEAKVDELLDKYNDIQRQIDQL